jgi:hypothetical protein
MHSIWTRSVRPGRYLAGPTAANHQSLKLIEFGTLGPGKVIHRKMVATIEMFQQRLLWLNASLAVMIILLVEMSQCNAPGHIAISAFV